MSATTTTSGRTLRRTPAHRSAHRHRSSLSTFLLALMQVLFVLGLMALLVFSAAMSIYAYFHFTGRIVPGISVRGVDLTHLTISEATAELDAQLNQPMRVQLVDSEDASRTWEITSSELGLRYDAYATAQSAFAFGRKTSIVMSLVEIAYTYWYGLPIEPLPALDADRAQQALEELLPRIEIPSQDGTLQINAGEVVAQGGSQGKQVHLQATLKLLEKAQSTVLEYGVLPVITGATEPKIGDVSPWAQEARAWIERELHLKAYDPVLDETLIWAPDPQEMASWVQIHALETGFQIEFDQAAARQDFEQWAQQLGPSRWLDGEQAFQVAMEGMHTGTSATQIIHYHPTTQQVNPYQTLTSLGAQIGMPYWKILEYNPELVGSGAIGRSTITIPPPDAMLELPVVAGKRIVISIEDQHMWVYQNGEQIADFVISTGMGSSPTLPGLFQIKSHYINAYASNWDLWMPHFMGIYDAVPGFENGIHGLPVLANGVRLWANVLGSPASYGCIILDLEAAEWLYAWAEQGVVVEILRSLPEQ